MHLEAPGQILVAVFGVAVLSMGLPAQRVASGSPPRCARGDASLASPFCGELVAVPELRTATGVLELGYVRSPFGIAVTPDGRLRHAVTLDIAGLPAPSSLGPYTTYVAWGYTLALGGEVRLGVVRNGRVRLGELPFEQSRVLVSAERSASVATRSGKLVMRATSPSSRMLAHRDANTVMTVGGTMPAHDSAGHTHHAPWPPPPPDPRIAPVATMAMAPSTRPWLPTPGAGVIPDARPRSVRRLANGDTLALEASLVRRRVAGRTLVMYGYNGEYPGPLIMVERGSSIVVRFRNAIDLPSTVHWHGIRLENASDGAEGVTQDAVPPGGEFVYRVRFRDAGVYWYHPHVREDIQQDLGLYGNILVGGAYRAARPRVNREEVLALDDVLLGDSALVPYGADTPTHALMGRFGNVLLINGEPQYTLRVSRGEVVRLYLTNVANARVFNVSFGGAQVKLIGSDVGDFEREERVKSIVLAPAERYIVELRFPESGTFAITNRVQWLDHMRGTLAPATDTLGIVEVSGERAIPDHAMTFAQVRTNAAALREIAPFRRMAGRKVDHQLTLGVQAPGLAPAMLAMLGGVPVPLDWNDGMPAMNWALTGREITWTFTDERGRRNMAIDWRFRTGDVVKLRLHNPPTAIHTMAHPVHIHGQRFLVVERNGVTSDNLAWKDTAVLPAGETMDILLELSNPGRWMLHCHVAEHLGTGMMMVFTVDDSSGAAMPPAPHVKH